MFASFLYSKEFRDKAAQLAEAKRRIDEAKRDEASDGLRSDDDRECQEEDDYSSGPGMDMDLEARGRASGGDCKEVDPRPAEEKVADGVAQLRITADIKSGSGGGEASPQKESPSKAVQPSGHTGSMRGGGSSSSLMPFNWF